MGTKKPAGDGGQGGCRETRLSGARKRPARDMAGIERSLGRLSDNALELRWALSDGLQWGHRRHGYWRRGQIALGSQAPLPGHRVGRIARRFGTHQAIPAVPMPSDKRCLSSCHATCPGVGGKAASAREEPAPYLRVVMLVIPLAPPAGRGARSDQRLASC